MTYLEHPISYTLIWHTVQDGKVCPICASLHGRRWDGEDSLEDWKHPDLLWDFVNDQSLAHPNCRCYLELNVTINLDAVKHYSSLNNIIQRVDP